MTTTPRRGRPPLAQPHICSVCGRPFRRGGRASAPALCPAHYHRERRGSPLAGSPMVRAQLPPGDAAESVTIYLRRELVERLRATALDEGVSMSQWVRHLVSTHLEGGAP